MAEDLTNVQLSVHASEIANRLKETGQFEDALTSAKFAMAYAIKYYLNDINPEVLESVYDSNGSNYNIGSLDADKYISQLIQALYPGVKTPYRYARVLMCYGLNKLGDLLDENKLFPLTNIM